MGAFRGLPCCQTVPQFLLYFVVMTSASPTSAGSLVPQPQSGVQSQAQKWKFLHAAPPHYTTLKLRASESINIDGKLDDAAWNAQGVAWTTDLVDITHHKTSTLNVVPDSLQARAKIRWDESFLYVGVELREPLITFNVTGHNADQVPYKDNDFEVFIDVSGTTQYYKEYEMSAGNATYDVLWGVPDGEGLHCAHNSTANETLPVCVNTTSHFYSGNWTMANTVVPGKPGGGLTSATFYPSKTYNTFVSPYAIWNAEIAFPLRSSVAHGGLLDAGPPYGPTFDSADPTANKQTYWHVDLSRAEHPRGYTSRTNPSEVVYCPLDCNANLSHWLPVMTPPNSSDCAAVQAKWPTLLGVDPWSCYWEWAIADVGPNAYMHRPLYWATLQFAIFPNDSKADVTCGEVEWPGRYLARLILVAERAYMAKNDNYTSSLSDVVTVCAVTNGCDVDDLRYALATPSTFSNITVEVGLADGIDCAHTVCFTAAISVAVDQFKYTVLIDSNSKLTTSYQGSGERPCLFSSPHRSLKPGAIL